MLALLRLLDFLFSGINQSLFLKKEVNFMIKSVISDLGNVIIFFDNHIFFRKIASYSPFSAEEIAEMVFDYSDIIRSFDMGKMTPEEFYTRVIKTLKAKIDYETFFPLYNDVFSLNPPTLKILRKLKSNYRLLLLSNTDVKRFGFVREKFPDILVFDEYILSYEVGCMKPDSQIYNVALKKAEADAGECVFIDDREENIEAAEKIGINCIHFGPQTDLETELRKMDISL